MNRNVFFCEACGAQVKGGAESCPECGRSFLGVRCPRCSHSGSQEEFLAGCPECGYLAPQVSVETAVKPPPNPPRRKEWPASRYWILSIILAAAAAALLIVWLNG